MLGKFENQIEPETSEKNIYCRPMSTDDLIKVPDFFDKVVGKYKQKLDTDTRLVFITVNHVVPTLLPYLKSLGELGDILSIIGKSSHIDNRVKENIKVQYPLLTPEDVEVYPSKEKLNNEKNNYEYARDFVANQIEIWRKKNGNQNVTPRLIIIDIGGYFASPLPALCSDQRIKDVMLGVVEDTENGHQKYEKIIKYANTCPVISVARSILKETEDWNVGKSIVEATDSLLRLPMHTIIERNSYTGVIGYGKIGSSIAFHCKNKGLNVLVCEFNPLRRMKASSQGFKTVGLDTIYQECSLIFAATGMQCIQKTDFKKLQDNVIISSCTSADDEFDLSWLLKNKKEEFNCDYEHYSNSVTTYLIDVDNQEKRINLLQEGNAVNFRFNGVNGPYICSVQASLLVAAMKLINFKGKKNNIHELSESTMKDIASIWNFAFDDKLPGLYKLPSFSSYNNEEHDPRMGACKQVEQLFLKSRTVYIIAEEQQLPIQFARTYASEKLKQSYYRLILYFDGSRDFYLEIKQFIKKTNEIFSESNINADQLSKAQIIKCFHKRLRQEGEWILILNADKLTDESMQTIIPSVLLYHQHVLIIKCKKPSPELHNFLELGDYTKREAKEYLSQKKEFSNDLIEIVVDKFNQNPMLLKYVSKGVLYSKKHTVSNTGGLGFVNGAAKYFDENSVWEESPDKKVKAVLDYLAGKGNLYDVFVKIRKFLSILACLNYDTLSYTVTKKIAEKIWGTSALEELDKIVDKGLLIKGDDTYSLPGQLRESLLEDKNFLTDLFRYLPFTLLQDLCKEEIDDDLFVCHSQILCDIKLLEILDNPRKFGVLIKETEEIRMTYNLYINLINNYDDSSNFVKGIEYCEKAYEMLSSPTKAVVLGLNEAKKIELYGCWVSLLYKADKQAEALEKCFDLLNMKILNSGATHKKLTFNMDSKLDFENFSHSIVQMCEYLLNQNSAWDHDLVGIIRTLANILECFDFLDCSKKIYEVSLSYYKKFPKQTNSKDSNEIKEAYMNLLMEYSLLLSQFNDRDCRLKAISLFSDAIDNCASKDEGFNLIIQAQYLLTQFRMKNDLAQHFEQPLKEIRLKIREKCSEVSIEYAEILKLLSECCIANKRVKKGISYLEEAIDLLKQFYDPECSLEIFKNMKILSNYYFKINDIRNAEDTMNEAMEILNKFQNTSQINHSYLLHALESGFEVSKTQAESQKLDIQQSFSHLQDAKLERIDIFNQSSQAANMFGLFSNSVNSNTESQDTGKRKPEESPKGEPSAKYRKTELSPNK